MAKPVEIDQPKTWKKFTPSLCEGCWATCCTYPVPVSSEDLFHMGYLKANEVNGPLEKVATRLLKKKVISAFNQRTRLFVLHRQANGDCGFLNKKRLCTIYERRPSVCRGYPFNNGVRPGYCPTLRKDSM